MEIIRKISLTIVATAKLLWHRLLYIALYSGALVILWLVGSFIVTQIGTQIVKAAPTENYLKYTAFTVNNIREGEDLTYTVCRDFKGNYTSTGRRTVYIIPQGGTTKDRKFLYNKDYTGSIEGDACQSYVIRDASYHLAPGKYQLTLSGDIPVEYGLTKHYYAQSTPFTVYAQPVGSNDYQIQINNLSTEIEALKERLGISVSESVIDTDTRSSTPAVVSTAPSSTPAVVSTAPSSTPSPTPRPAGSSAPATTSRPCAVGLLGLCIMGLTR